MQSLGNASAQTEQVNEGSASLLVPAGNKVFYNPVQNVNRDVSVLALDVFARQFQLEHDTKETMRMSQQAGWRKSYPTWNHWGLPPRTEESTSEDAAEPAAKRAKVSPPTSATAAAPRKAFNLRILEALAASGLRSIRYAKEIAPSIPKKITANDLSESACASIRANAERNGPYTNGTEIVASHSDAVDVMMRNRKPQAMESTLGNFEVVDLDPYGSPSIFLDSAVQAVVNGGMLCVTATDLAVLAGTNPEKCHSKYGSVPIHRAYGHEMALRIVLASIETAANRFGRHIVPQLSLKLDFYLRVFVRVYDSPLEVKRSTTRLAHVYQSKGCDTYHIVPLGTETGNERAQPSRLPKEIMRPCDETGQDWMVGGPMWSAPTNNPAFVDACLRALVPDPRRGDAMVLKYRSRVEGILAAVKAELHDVPLYMSTSSMFRTIHATQAPLERIQAAIVNAGYRVSQCHHDPQAVKTDAPCSVVWDIVRCWVAKMPVASTSRVQDPKSTSAIILAKKPVLDADFDPPKSVRDARRRLHKNDKRSATGTAARPKWDPNPEPNWGPKPRASTN